MTFTLCTPRYRTVSRLALLAAVAVTLASPGRAEALPFATTQSSQFLLIGMGPENTLGARPGVGQAVNINNFEIGANKANVPATSDFLNSGGGPGLRGNVPNIPLAAKPVGTGITNDGNVAITSPGGVFNLQDVGVYANLGILCALAKAACDAGTQNSFFNDPNQFPNTFTPTGTGAPTNNNVDGTGLAVNPGAAVQSTRIDKPNAAGVTGDVNFSLLLAELTAASFIIQNLALTGTLDVRASGGKITKSADGIVASGITVTDLTINDGRGGTTGDNSSDVGLTTILLQPGLNVIDIITDDPGNEKDFLLENSSLVIDGPANAFAIFRVPDTANFGVASGNILVGNGGIGLNNVLFYSDKPDNDTHFSFSNTVINGVAFWTLGEAGGGINIQNGQGCTQLVGDKIALDDVRFMRCAFGEQQQVPEPATLGLLGVGLVGLAAARLTAMRRTR